jgi:ABC-type antimicrobial peptide transport system permease subunit
VLVPIQTAARRIFNTTWLTAVYVSVTVPEQMDEAELEIQRLLRARHQRGLDSRTDDFSIQNTAKIRSVQQEMTQSLSRFGAGLAGIALLVGGVGILALMLLSVRERASEIGLRMAVGARPRDILIQFLAEATALSLGGWIGGMAVGGAAALAVARFTTWTVGVPVPAVLASFAMAVIIGLGFGVVPARNASRIPPIEALSRT